jgi:hypothetical protein
VRGCVDKESYRRLESVVDVCGTKSYGVCDDDQDPSPLFSTGCEVGFRVALPVGISAAGDELLIKEERNM